MNTIKRLKKYLEIVAQNIQGTQGPLKEFWQREQRKTTLKIESLTK